MPATARPLKATIAEDLRSLGLSPVRTRELAACRLRDSVMVDDSGDGVYFFSDCSAMAFDTNPHTGAVDFSVLSGEAAASCFSSAQFL